MLRTKDTDLLMAVAAYIVLKNKEDSEREERRIEREEPRRRRRRKYSINPYLKEIGCRGRFASDLQNVSRNPTVFYKKFHMDEKCFEHLYHMTEPYLVAKRNTRPDAIPLRAKLAMVLEFLAVGDIQSHMSSIYGISVTHFGLTVELVCNAINKALVKEFPLWTAGRMEKWSEEFLSACNFPNTIGAIDVKHIGIWKPSNSGKDYCNNKGFYSILLLAVCDASYRFTYVDIGAHGSKSDMAAFTECSLGKALLSNHMLFPEDTMVNGAQIPYFFVADDAFRLHKRIMKPFGSRNITGEERIFNDRLDRARRCIDNAFGILSTKWMSVQGTLRCHPDRLQKIVLTCCSLHNFMMRADAKQYGSLKDVEIMEISDAPTPEILRGRKEDYPKYVRDILKKYVNSTAGALPSANICDEI